MTTTIVSRSATALTTQAIRLAWSLITIGEQGTAKLGTVEHGSPLAMRLYERLRAAGEALEVIAERAAPKLGVDILVALAPLS